MDTQLKPGYKTSEFVLVVVIAVLTQLDVLQVGGDRYKGVITAALAIAYAVSRGLAKAFPPKDDGAAVPAELAGRPADPASFAASTDVGDGRAAG